MFFLELGEFLRCILKITVLTFSFNDLQEMLADCDYAGESSNVFWFKGNGNYGVENFAHLSFAPHWSMFRI